MKRIVISGPTGSIGRALIKKCMEQNVEVLAICHKGSKRMQNIPQNPLVSVLKLNLDEYKDYVPLNEKKYDAFFHFAWNGTFGDTRNDMPLQIKNIQYTLDAVELAEKFGCKIFVGAGSQAEYGRVEGVLNRETKTNPENGYGMAKLCAGFMSRQACHQKGIRHIWTRILSVYGPGDNAYTMVMSTLQKMLSGEKTSFTRGEQIWDYLYADDAAEILFRLGEKGRDGHTYCLGSGEPHPLSYYIEIMKKMTQSKLPLGLGEIPYSDKQVMHLETDISDLISDLQYKPCTSFEQGIRATIDWINQRT